MDPQGPPGPPPQDLVIWPPLWLHLGYSQRQGEETSTQHKTGLKTLLERPRLGLSVGLLAS